MTKHEKIYLCTEKESVTYNCWCEDKRSESDIEYILKSKYDELEKRNDESELCLKDETKRVKILMDALEELKKLKR